MKHYFDVFRMTETEQDVRIEREYTEGYILGEYLLMHPKLEKRQVFLWLKEFTDQLTMTDKLIISPFHMILKPNQSVAFLDPEAQVNQKHLKRIYHLMSRFLNSNFPKDNPLYAYGQTVQFIFANSELHPKLTKREKRKITKLIRDCSNVGERKKTKNILLISIGVILCVCLFLIFQYFDQNDFSQSLYDLRNEDVENVVQILQETEEQLLYVREICESERLGQQQKNVLLEKFVKDNPWLLEKKRFERMQEIYGFRVEGEEVWFER